MWCAIYLGCLLTVGYGVSAVLVARKSHIERFGVAACLGPGITALCLIALSMCGWAPSRLAIGLVTVIFAAGGLFLWKKQPPTLTQPDGGPPAPLWWIGLCLAIAAYGILTVALNALVYPTFNTDAFAIWQLKAKVLAAQALHPRPAYFDNISLSYSHLRYPLLVPMISAGMHAMTGRLDDPWQKAPFLLTYLGLGAYVFAAIKKWRGPAAAAAAVALLMTTPSILFYDGSGAADAPLAAFFGGSVICILRWQRDGRWQDLILATMFAACVAWTKQEGLVLAAIDVAAVAALTPHPLRRRNLWAAAAFALAVAVLYLPWILYSRNLPRTDENYTQHLNLTELAAHLPRLPQIATGMAGELMSWVDWGFFWWMLPLTALLSPRRLLERPIWTLWILLICQLLAYVPPFMVAPWDLNWLLEMVLDRLFLHATPAAALLIGLQWPQLPRPAATADRPAPLVH